ncbi:MAG TPA: DUF177 domain-containing protein [Thermoleophilaceae bacterium]|nr:DUF177 domain-containing protein [Thermoleophilaceae bacterium]
MAMDTHTLDLGQLALTSGEGRRLDLATRVEPLVLAGQRYVAEDAVAVRIDISRTTKGYSLRLRAGVPLEGPCMRCLERADREISIDAREIDQPGGGEDLTSPYVDGDELAVGAWTRDALALALPARIVCREECRGLCGICGENLNTAGPGHAHEPAPDPRWAALRELRLE